MAGGGCGDGGGCRRASGVVDSETGRRARKRASSLGEAGLAAWGGGEKCAVGRAGGDRKPIAPSGAGAAGCGSPSEPDAEEAAASCEEPRWWLPRGPRPAWVGEGGRGVCGNARGGERRHGSERGDGRAAMNSVLL